MPSFLKSALAYADMGWPVFPLAPRSKHPLIEGPGGYKLATLDKKLITTWWTDNPDANIGLPVGIKFWVLDVDVRSNGVETLEQLETKHGKLPNTVQQVTGSGGKHYLFSYDRSLNIHSVAGAVGPGLDVKGDTGYIAAAPSIHPDTGKRYYWDGIELLKDQVLLPAPDWLIEIATAAKKTKAGAIIRNEPILGGGRNDTLISVAGSMRRAGLTETEILAGISAFNANRCKPPLLANEVASIANSASKYPAGKIAIREPPPPWNHKKVEVKREQGLPSRKATAVIQEHGGLEPYLDAKHHTGILGPWFIFNKATGGLRPGELIILAGSTSRGKTSFALNYAYNVARRNIGVVIFSLEMSDLELTDRLLCLAGDIELEHVSRGRVPNFKAVQDAADVLHDMPLYIVDCPGLTIPLLSATLARIRETTEIGLVVCDNLQLMSGPRSGGRENRVQEVSALSRGLKLVAKDSGIPFLVISHLSRASGKEKRRPELYDLRDSGTIEQDANSVFFLHGKDEYGENPPKIIDVELIISKQRNGPRGKVVQLRFHRHIGRFEEKDS